MWHARILRSGSCLGLIVLLAVIMGSLMASPRHKAAAQSAPGGGSGSGSDIVPVPAGGPGNGGGAETQGSGSGSRFTTVQIQGNANLNAGNLAGSGAGSSDANSSIGVYAESNSGLSIIAAFSFGSKGTSLTAKSVSDYVSFLEQPSSTLGGQVKLQQSWSLRAAPWFRVGLALNTRAFSVDMGFGDSGASQRINLLALDPSLAFAARLDDAHKLSVVGELGLATRFWNKPGAAFQTALNIVEGHAFAGPRVAAAISIGDIYAGIEMTRYFGAVGLQSLREFAIVPYVGIRGSLTLVPNRAAGTQSAPSSAAGETTQTPMLQLH